MHARVLVLAAAVLAVLVSVAVADVPIHCIEPQIVGTWTVSATEFKFDHGVDCNAVPDDEFTQKLTVKLGAAPSIDEVDGRPLPADDDSSWTMIYDEGFELRFRNQVWWSRFHYGKTKAEQDCTKTMVGVAHEKPASGKFPDSYACFKAAHASATPVEQLTLDPAHWRVLPERPVRFGAEENGLEHASLINAVNAAGVSWTAKTYEPEHLDAIQTSLSRQGAWPRVSPRARPNTSDLSDLPASFDWSNVDGQSFVGPVLNQGHCGSCYTFGSLGSVNDRIRVKSKNQEQVSLAEQEILSCSHYSEGCDGGFAYNVAKFVRDFGIVDDTCMPYKAESTECTLCDAPKIYTIDDYQYINGAYGLANEEGMMRDLYQYGPLAIGFMVTPDFMHYHGGVYGCDSRDAISAQLSEQDAAAFTGYEEVNHAVLLVGWGVDQDSGKKFWRVRNSWGAAWGEDGFFRIQRGVDCLGVESCAASLRV